MQESRCFKILYYLLDKGKTTAPELANKLEVSVRTIYRDLDVLSMAGIPLYTNPGKGGGIFIQENFELNKVLLSDQEKEQILLALKEFSPIENEHNHALATKLGSLFQIKSVDWIEISQTDWQSGSMNHVFNQIKTAILNQLIINLHYSSMNEDTKRNVAPIKLIFKNSEWYLYAYCFLRNDYRFFKLKRIHNLQTTNKTYESTLIVPLPIDTTLHSETMNVKLKFNKSMAYRVYDDFYGEVAEGVDALWVETTLPNNDYIISYLLTFGDALEVIEPLQLRNQFKEKINKMHLIY